jgi:hypothetical protein
MVSRMGIYRLLYFLIVVVTIINTIIKPFKKMNFMEQGAVTTTMVHLNREYPNMKIKVYPNLMVC